MGEGTRIVGFQIDETTLQEIDKFARSTERSRSAAVRLSLRAFLRALEDRNDQACEVNNA